MNWVENPNGNTPKDYPQGPELIIPRDDLPAFQIASFALTQRGLTQRVVLAPNPYPFLRYAHHPENTFVRIILPESTGDLVLDVATDLIEFRKNNQEITPEEWQHELNLSIKKAVKFKDLQEKNHANPYPNPYIPQLI